VGRQRRRTTSLSSLPVDYIANGCCHVHLVRSPGAEVLKTTDDSLSAFPRAWRQADAAPNTAQLAEQDITKAAPTAKALGAHPSQGISSVSIQCVWVQQCAMRQLMRW
jgi:hypothetical protein